MQEFHALLEALNGQSLLTGTAGFLAGTWVGLRIQLLLERRREFNAAAFELRADLQRFMGDVSPMQRGLDERLLDVVLHTAPGPLQRRRVARCVRQWHQAREQKQESDAHGGVHYSEPQQVSAAARLLFRALKPI